MSSTEAQARFEDVSEEALGQLVQHFYARVRKDPLIGPLFNRAIEDWPEHLEKLQAFWSSVMLTSGRYKGRPLPAHAKHGDAINDESFARWLSLWHQTTGDLFTPKIAETLQNKAAQIARSLSLGIAYSRDPNAILR